MEVLSKPYVLDGTGNEIDDFNVADVYERYIVTGTAVGIGNYAISIVGTPTTNTKFYLQWRASLDITTTPVTFSILGQSITANQLLYDFDAVCTYNGVTWDVLIDRSETGVTTETENIKNNAITNTKLAQMATNTVKANVTGSTADPQDVAISTFFGNTAWKTDGNSGLTAGTNFLGTTDNIDLVFKVNSIESGRIDVSNLNTSFGQGSLLSITTGIDNTAIGYAALAAASSVDNSTAIGKHSLVNVTTGDGNTAVGEASGDTITIGSNNTIIGFNAQVDSVSAISRIALGKDALADADYQFTIPTDVVDVQFTNATITSEGLVITSKTINTTAGDSATIDAVAGRFRKDTSGTTFTLTNSYITANSIIILTNTTAGITTGNQLSVVAGVGSAVITFETGGIAAAPSANMDVNFWVIN